MSLKVETYSPKVDHRAWRPGNNFGGTTLFKALGHPLVVTKARSLVAGLMKAGRTVVYDPKDQAESFDAFYPLSDCDIAGVCIQRIEDLGKRILGRETRPVSDLPRMEFDVLLVAAYHAQRLVDHVRHLIPAGTKVVTFDDLRLPDDMLTVQNDYLHPLNFATNFGFLRDADGHHTQIASANYWSGYGATNPELWLCLFNEDGEALAEWREKLPGAGGTYAIDSREVRERFGLGEFTGSLFMHAIRIAGHDVIKYAVDTYGDDEATLSCTHDANAWPADLYAGMPAPDQGERVVLWIQNSHPVAIPPGGVGLNAMGTKEIRWLQREIPPYGTYGLNVSDLLPKATWPTQIEVQAGRYFVRPRYEVLKDDGRRRIAHANVERTDLRPDPRIPELGAVLGKGYILPLPVLPLDRFASAAMPTPMATCERELPVRAILLDASGETVAERYLGRIPRKKSVVVDVDAWLTELGRGLPSGTGHLEFAYDFREGGEADGWLHGFCRYKLRATGHVAETIFGAHIYNTPIVYKDEPQSYIASPPGLSTRLFLRLGNGRFDTMCHLIYPASTPWHPRSATDLILVNRLGEEIAGKRVEIPCGGSLHWRYHDTFDKETRARAGTGASVLIRDRTCRLFGFHGVVNGEASFSFDHMFGF